MRPFLNLVYSDDEAMRCVHISIVIKMDALRKKYKGGPKAFAEKHYAKCNREIAVLCAMSDFELEGPANELVERGMVHKEAFLYFDVICDIILPHSMAKGPTEDSPRNFNLGVDWLEGYIEGNAVMVSCPQKHITFRL